MYGYSMQMLNAHCMDPDSTYRAAGFTYIIYPAKVNMNTAERVITLITMFIAV